MTTTNIPQQPINILKTALAQNSYRELQKALKVIRYFVPELVNCKLTASKSKLIETANTVIESVAENEEKVQEEKEKNNRESGLEAVPSKIATMLKNAVESGVYRNIQLALKAVRHYAPKLINIKLNASKSILKQQAEAILA